MTIKKSSQTQKAKPGRQRIKTSVSEAQTISDLRQQLAESLQRERNVAQALQERDVQLAEAVEQQTATGEILRIISTSPTDLQSVFDAIAESAVRLCNGVFGAVYRLEGDI